MEAVAFKDAAVHLADREFRVNYFLQGGAAEGQQEEGLDMGNLGDEIRVAGVSFNGKGGAVARRTAFDDVGDEDFLATQAGVKEDIVQKLAGGADEGTALDVFLFAWTFADEHQAGVFGAFTRDGVSPTLPEGALLAGLDYIVEFP
jgi:hypothetical protein